MTSQAPIKPVLEEIEDPSTPQNNATRQLWLLGFRAESLFKDADGNTLCLWLNQKDDDSRISVRVKGKVIIYAPVQGKVVREVEGKGVRDQGSGIREEEVGPLPLVAVN